MSTVTPVKVIKSLAVTDATLVGTSVPEADYAAWSNLPHYGLGDRVIITTGVHKIYESIQVSNHAHDPVTSPDWWVEVSATNLWKLFDLSSTTQTTIDASDYFEFAPGQAVNSFSLINISGVATVRVRLTDPIYGVVYDSGVLDILFLPSAADWYVWFFEPKVEQAQFLLRNLPSYPNAVLRVDLTSAGTANIGAMVFGSEHSLGKFGVQLGARLGIVDYSRKERNQWGDVVLVKRAYSSRLNISITLNNEDLDNTYRLLADLRSTPCLWLASDTYSSLSVFGFFSNFEIAIPYPLHSVCSLDLEGLT